MTRFKTPEFCERCKIDIRIPAVESKKKYFLGLLRREINVYTLIKINFVLFGRKTEKIVYLTG